jgi:hypothetical protein
MFPDIKNGSYFKNAVLWQTSYTGKTTVHHSSHPGLKRGTKWGIYDARQTTVEK